MPNRPLVCRILPLFRALVSPDSNINDEIGMYHGFDWYGRSLEVREVGTVVYIGPLVLKQHSRRIATQDSLEPNFVVDSVVRHVV